MTTDVKRYVLEEIEEVDEFAFYALIPRFLQQTKGIELKGELLSDSKSNFNISDTDFSDLQSTIKSLIESENLEICRYYDTHSTKRKDYLRPLKKEEQEAFLKKKTNWIYDKDKPAYFLCRKE